MEYYVFMGKNTTVIIIVAAPDTSELSDPFDWLGIPALVKRLFGITQ